MTTLLAFLSQTPWWVYVLFFYLMSLGIGALQPKVVSILKLAILPIVFTALSIHTLMVSFTLNSLNLSVWGGSIFFATLIGILLVSGYDYKVDKKNLLILLPGTWTTLILILIIFSSKYYFSYALSTNPAMTNNTNFDLTMLGISGGCTGLFIGRFLYYAYEFFAGESVNLKQIE